jgi:hypothetical protein
VPAALDQPHGWTSIGDVATTPVTVATDDRAWGQAWLTANPPLTVREIAPRFTEVAGAPKPKLTALPYPVLWTAGLFSPLIRGVAERRVVHPAQTDGHGNEVAT